MNHLNRRQFAAVSVASLAGIAAAGRAWARQASGDGGKATPADINRNYLYWKRLDSGVWAAIGREGYPFAGGNTLVVVGAEKTLLSDTKLAALGAELAAECAQVTGKSPTIVFNTHHHMDHTGGNAAFVNDRRAGQALRLASQTKAKPRIAGQVKQYAAAVEGQVTEIAKAGKPGSDLALARAQATIDASKKWTEADFAPTETFDDSKTFDLGGVEVRAMHIGPGHTDNDAFLFLPKQNILQTGDLLFNKLHPFIDGKAGASSTGWQTSLKALMALCDDKTVVIPGHGAITGRAALQEQHDYWDKLRAVVADAKKAGSSREEVTKLHPKGFEGYSFEQMLPNALGVLFDELSK